jgi:hypothetical protein
MDKTRHLKPAGADLGSATATFAEADDLFKIITKKTPAFESDSMINYGVNMNYFSSIIFRSYPKF